MGLSDSCDRSLINYKDLAPTHSPQKVNMEPKQNHPQNESRKIDCFRHLRDFVEVFTALSFQVRMKTAKKSSSSKIPPQLS